MTSFLGSSVEEPRPLRRATIPSARPPRACPCRLMLQEVSLSNGSTCPASHHDRSSLALQMDEAASCYIARRSMALSSAAIACLHFVAGKNCHLPLGIEIEAITRANQAIIQCHNTMHNNLDSETRQLGDAALTIRSLSLWLPQT